MVGEVGPEEAGPAVELDRPQPTGRAVDLLVAGVPVVGVNGDGVPGGRGRHPPAGQWLGLLRRLCTTTGAVTSGWTTVQNLADCQSAFCLSTRY